ncbi:MAG TPA: FGGY family carbohydrate kinase [Kofleriaceae bacterium]|nr:FGGY family carbohydrate kinase [Kofleriaceae bacterium]
MIIGIDVGTQSVKVVVCDDGLAVLGAASESYPVHHPRPGWAEQDPRDWERALGAAIAAALRDARARADDVTAIGIAGQLDGCIAVDDRGAAIGRALIWIDRRATAELPALDPDAFAQITGQIADASHMAAKIRWLDRHAPGARRFHQPVTYLVARLCGEAVMDPSLASTTMLWDLRAGAWSEPLCEAFEIDPLRLPRVAPAHDTAGALTPAGAAITGLRAGTIVAVGTGDDFATPLGAGVVAPGTIACVLGTAEVVGALHPSIVIDANKLVETHAYPTSTYFIENPGWIAGGAITWLCDLLETDPATLDRAAEHAAGDVTFLPALGGAMAPEWHANARGAFYGLTPAHGRGELARAVLEGCAFAARDVIDRLASLGVATDRVLLLGGGASSRVWARIRADVTQRPHAIAARTDTCAIGGALCASVAARIHGDVIAAASLAPPPVEVIDPGVGQDASYDRYRRLFDSLKPLF